MVDDFPELDKNMSTTANGLMQAIFREYLVELKAFEDGRFRVVFDGAYFNLDASRITPSKSQWSSLKKRFKRHHKGIFVFKETGESDDTPVRYYVDFGFFRH